MTRRRLRNILSVSLLFCARASAEYSCTDDWIGDGWCDQVNNNEACDYDGGDCCQCSCIDGEDLCGYTSDFECLDPAFRDGQLLSDCNDLSSLSSACGAGYQRKWVIENTSYAHNLVEAMKCSGGMFEVEWRGHIVIDSAILVFHGTTLNVTGIDSSAVIDGGGNNRLFTVVNASLSVNGLKISSGAASFGGAVAASRSSLIFNRTTFVGNIAVFDGGALFLSESSTASFGHGYNNFFNNTAGRYGGAAYLSFRSSTLWTGESNFTANTAAGGGALLLVWYSNSSWLAQATFSTNTATALWGGALCVRDRSRASWASEVTFIGNIAVLGPGGALAVKRSCNVSWEAEAVFIDNSANYAWGGAMIVQNNSQATWEAQATFSGNTAIRGSGGALLVWGGASVSWKGGATFSGNIGLDGGALYVTNLSRASWSADTLFMNNTADHGGGVLVAAGSILSSSGRTNFISNYASVNGGAVGSEVFGLTASPGAGSINNIESFVIFQGNTTFVNNSCGVSGGALAMMGVLSVAFEKGRATFAGNSADVSGGAVFILSTGIGPEFRNSAFISNSAQVGGAVYARESGTVITSAGEHQQENPTKFIGCDFINNSADGSGGALDSVSGQDLFHKTVFQRNQAKVGGALRLAGTASLYDCLFEDNISESEGAPAVSSIGSISNLTKTFFSHNVFNCEYGTFLSFISNKSDLYKTICDGCPQECLECTFDKPLLTPKCVSLEAAGINHAVSHGGVKTVEELTIEQGYWRTTSKSIEVLECYNKGACKGGVTGASGYCKEGYKGPYCSVCSEGYTKSIGFTCEKCSNTTKSIVIIAAVTLIGITSGLVLAFYLSSANESGAGRGLADRITRCISIQSVKIIIVAWQILTQFTTVANVTYPNVYGRLLNHLDLLNFDLTWVISIGCVFPGVNFHDRLVVTTIGPIVGMGFIAVTYIVSAISHRESVIALQNVLQKHISVALLLTFFVYSSVSSVLFQMFACDVLDNGSTYLRADYSIECDDPNHRMFQVYAGFMILLYPVGIPMLYAVLLFINRKALTERVSRENSSRMKSISQLWKPYKPERFYYEVVECGRRILLTGVIVFIFPNSAAQVAITILIELFFAFVSELLAPYAAKWDAWISRIGHTVVFISMYLALLLKVDVSKERAHSQMVFEVILVSIHICLVVAVVVEAIALTWSLKSEQREDPIPRWRGIRRFPATQRVSDMGIEGINLDRDDRAERRPS